MLRLWRSTVTRAGRLVGSIDQGTSSTRFILFNEKAQKVASYQKEHAQIYPKEGWCEHDPMEIIQNTRECVNNAFQEAKGLGYKVDDIAGIGITNQRETTIVWDKYTGKPLHNAIVWLDLRTTQLAEGLEEKYGSKDHFRPVCGLPISTYFSGIKLRWLLENVPKVKQAVDEGRAMFGTIDTWLIWNLTGGANDHQSASFVTDVTNASRTMLMDLSTRSWHKETCNELGVPLDILPEIRSCAEVYGHMSDTDLSGVPISGCAGDQHAAMLGQCAFTAGEAKNTYGTGCFMLMNVGEQPVQSDHGLLSTVCFQLGADAPVNYALEGSTAVAGRAVQWLRDNLGILANAKEIEALASEVPGTEGVVFVPAFSGLFAPYWRSDARACILGLTLYSTRAHIARAALEAITFQTQEVLEAMEADSNVKLATLKVDGGMTVNNLLMQLQANAVQVPVARPIEVETTALGAAFAAGIATGVWSGANDLNGINPVEKTFMPEISPEDCEKKMVVWKDAITRTFNLARHDD
eukprot:m.48196 g.48196  ORF g.48196 m.48196 type:complete len:522 (+) comp10556_c0_seq3:122-1687(+)